MSIETNENFYITNLKPDEYDERDYIYRSNTVKLPDSVDLRKYAGEIENQGRTGSCVANATCSVLELLSEGIGKYKDLSRLFLYYNLREPYSFLKEQDKGAYTRDGFKMTRNQGVCLETTWNFDVSKVNVKPDEKSYTEALDIKTGRYERIDGFSYGTVASDDGIINIKNALASGIPVLIGMKLGKTFYNVRGSLETQSYNGLNNDEIGGHAMCIVGYIDELKGFIVENSWGSSWGDKGFCLIPYEVMKKDCHDVWVCTEFLGHDFVEKPIVPRKYEPVVPEKPSFFEKNKYSIIVGVGILLYATYMSNIFG